MNQALQFPDREQWDDRRQAVCFPALNQGMQLNCAISGEELRLRYGAGDPLDLFRRHRWDLEEDAEQLIMKDQDDAEGWYWLSSDK